MAVSEYKVVAEFDYVGADTSQLTFNEGDIIIVLEEDSSGWWTGRMESTGTEGYFPETYVKKVVAPSRPPPPPAGSGAISAQPKKKAPAAPLQYDGIGSSSAATTTSSRSTGGVSKFVPPSAASAPSGISANRDDALSEMYYSENLLNLKVNPNAKSRFGIAAHYMAIAAAGCSILLGMSCMLWGGNDASPALEVDKTLATLVGVYLFFMGIIMIVVEQVYGTQRKQGGLPFRGMGYIALAIFPFTTLPSALAGGMWLITGIFDCMAWVKKEEYSKDKRKKRNEKTWQEKIGKYFSVKTYTDWCVELRQQSKTKKYIFLFVFLLFNVVYTLERAVYYSGVVKATNQTAKEAYNDIQNGEDEDMSGEDRDLAKLYTKNRNDLVLGDWFPLAKMFGNLLDINAAFIVLPVCRSFIRYLYNLSTDQRASAKCLAYVLTFMPLDKAIQWHKVMAGLCVFGTVFHGWAHYNHFAQVPKTYEAVYGPTVWVTGITCIIIMQILYATSFEAVRRGKFELFWYTHHLFSLFFLSILFHGAGSVNPNYWKWFLIPGTLYLVERSLREYKASRPVGVVSITHMNNKTAKVFCLELEKTGPISSFQEGQYVFVNAPIITKWQWHPFTISSPPDQKTLTLHIRNMGDGTWTGRLQDFFQALAPRKAYVELFHRDGNNMVPQTKGPDGNNLICIDGPMAAPTQHLGEYSTAMVVGAGIGVTPVRATLQSIVYYRFKKGVGDSYPNHAYMVWIVNWKQLPAYRFMARTLKEAEDELYDMRAKSPETMSEKTLQVHVFVTRPPDPLPRFDESGLRTDGDRDKDLATWGPHYDDVIHEADRGLQTQKAPFSEVDILRALATPTDEPKALGDIIIHKGRPNWPELFQPIAQHHHGNKIGVMFCGPDIIASSLKVNCGTFTDHASGTVFLLHKENF